MENPGQARERFHERWRVWGQAFDSGASLGLFQLFQVLEEGVLFQLHFQLDFLGFPWRWTPQSWPRSGAHVGAPPASHREQNPTGSSIHCSPSPDPPRSAQHGTLFRGKGNLRHSGTL